MRLPGFRLPALSIQGDIHEFSCTGAAVAVDPSHPIFNGPATPNATSFTGDSFAHGRVSGPELTPLIVGTENEGPVSGAVALAEHGSGMGHLDTVQPPAPPVPPAPPAVPDTTKPTVKFSGIPKKCVTGGFRFQVTVSDAGGVGPVRVKLGGKLLRKVDGKGQTSRVVKVHVPDGKLDHAGAYRIKAVAHDRAGNVKRKSAGFRVCG
ncbi:MAG: hypothetical protein ACTHK3_09270 [Solirubrobacterales bacterium]